MHDLASPDSPYVEVNSNMGGWFLQSLLTGAGLPPEAVADVIAECVADDDPKLRYLVGKDAEGIVAARDADPEAWARTAAAPTDEWWAAMTEVTGIPRPG